MGECRRLTKGDYFEEKFKPQDEDIHVKVEARANETTKKHRLELDISSLRPVKRPASDYSESWRAHFKEIAHEPTVLPSLDVLPAFLASSLQIKVWLDASAFARLASRVDISVLNKACVAHKTTICRRIYSTLLEPITGDGAAVDQASMWDTVLSPCLTMGQYDGGYTIGRSDPNQSLQLEATRPRIYVELGQTCVVRGEEATSSALAETTLREPFVWQFGPHVPYVFGFTVVRHHCTLFAFHSRDQSTVQMSELGSYDATDATERLKLVLAVLQLGRLLRTIVTRSSDKARLAFFDIRRPNGSVVRLNPTCVVKDFTKCLSPHSVEVVDTDHLEHVYRQLGALKVPYVDRLVHVSASGEMFVFKPRGSLSEPIGLDALFSAIECVLSALVVVHRNGWMHRDIDWTNVMRYRGVPPPRWFLIDFCEAATSPQRFPSGTQINCRNHTPEIFLPGGTHTTAVDLWSVGLLIRERDLRGVWTSDKPRRAFLSQLLSGEPNKRPTAEKALTTLKRLRRQHEKANQA